jgi:dihydrofolate synthase/folylpolyglutamate synthase
LNYSETLQFLFEQLPMYQRQGKSAFKKDLTNILELCKHLDHPETKFKSIHVAGTNGKGSVSHMLASVLQENGYKAGLYTSPHLLDFRERIRVDGQTIPEQNVVDFVAVNQAIIRRVKPSFFEITVAMAFQHFADSKVDFAVIETGLGGRLDSTNVILPELSIITNIGWDHMDMLGDTLAAIAREKAGIIKPNRPVVLGETLPETLPVFQEKAKKENAPLYRTDQMELGYQLMQTDLLGNYQANNLKTVGLAIQVLHTQGICKLHKETNAKALMHVTHNTGLRGRWEIIQKNPLVVCDTGHNAEGITAVMQQLSEIQPKHLHIIWGMVEGKELDKILTLLPKDASYYLCEPNIPRRMNQIKLEQAFLNVFLDASTHDSVMLAYEDAFLHADPEDVIFVGGSTFVVADFLAGLELDRQAPKSSF